MNESHVCGTAWTETELLVRENIKAGKEFKESIIHNPLKYLGEGRQNRNRTVVADIMRVAIFKDRSDLSNFQTQWNDTGRKR